MITLKEAYDKALQRHDLALKRSESNSNFVKESFIMTDDYYVFFDEETWLYILVNKNDGTILTKFQTFGFSDDVSKAILYSILNGNTDNPVQITNKKTS